MLQLQIPQEINKYESKLVGSLTTRQTFSIVGMAIVAVGGYNLLKNIVSGDLLYAICLTLAVPFALIGWKKVDGMPFEKFFMAVLFNTIISTSRRIFKSESIISNIEKKLTTASVQELNGKKQKKAKKEKQPNPKKIRKKYKKHTML